MNDQIKALTEQRDEARRDAVEAEAYATELEANLAKALDALQTARANLDNCGSEVYAQIDAVLSLKTGAYA